MHAGVAREGVITYTVMDASQDPWQLAARNSNSQASNVEPPSLPNSELPQESEPRRVNASALMIPPVPTEHNGPGPDAAARGP